MVEADEYAGNFDPYRPDVTVLTSASGITPTSSPIGPQSIDCFAAWLKARR